MNAAVFFQLEEGRIYMYNKCICVICVYLGMLPTTVWKGSGSQTGSTYWLFAPGNFASQNRPTGFQPWVQVRNPKKFWIMGNIPGYWILMMWLAVLQGYQSNQDSFMQAVWFLQLPGTCLSPVLRLQPSKTRSFPIKTGVIWVPARYMTGNGCDPKNFKLLT